jgi:hypothetical protein
MFADAQKKPNPPMPLPLGPITPPAFDKDRWQNLSRELRLGDVKPRLSVIPVKDGANFTESREIAEKDGGIMPKAADILASSKADFRDLVLTLVDHDWAYLADNPGSLTDKQVKEFVEKLNKRIKEEVPEVGSKVPSVLLDGCYLILRKNVGIVTVGSVYGVAAAPMVLSMRVDSKGTAP